MKSSAILAENKYCSDFENLLSKINNRTAKIAIFGIGYIGLPVAKNFCRKGYTVFGFDPDETKIKSLYEKKSYISHIPDTEISELMDSQKFSASVDISGAENADVIIICVPTPLTENRDPDMRHVIDATMAIASLPKRPQLITLESTTYPGSVRGLMKPILENARGPIIENFFLAYSPEREDPGNPIFKTNSIPKVVGAEDEYSMRLACALYESIVPRVIPVSSIEVAESVKLTENIFRWININLVNELKMIFQDMGIDVWEVLEAAETKPFGYMPFYPGPGIGGHCIPVDPLYLNWKIKSHGLHSKFIDIASQVNTEVNNYVMNKISEAMDITYGRGLKGARVLLIGISYKRNVNDVRESPAILLYKKLCAKNAIVSYHDPLIPSVCVHEKEFECINGAQSVDLSEEALTSHDVVVICTNHDGVDYSLIEKHAHVIVDTRNACRPSSKIIKA